VTILADPPFTASTSVQHADDPTPAPRDDTTQGMIGRAQGLPPPAAGARGELL